jgi:hypothetical protein
MSKKPKPPAELDLTSIVCALDHANDLLRDEVERLVLVKSRIADAKRGIVAYALAVAPVVEEEAESNG